MGIKAVVNGKLNGSHCNDRSEDLLTSNIFQNLSYLPFDDGLKTIIDSVNNLSRNRIDLKVNKDDIIKYKYWERHTSCEPDLIIEIRRENKVIYALMIEMKFLSKKSSSALFDEDHSYIDNTDQLQKEYVLLQNLYKQSNNYLLYITKDVFPYDEIVESERAIGIDNVIYHTNYMQIYKRLNLNKGKKIINDIIELFAFYGMQCFTGWKGYKENIQYDSIITENKELLSLFEYKKLGEYKWI